VVQKSNFDVVQAPTPTASAALAESRVDLESR